MFAALIEFTNAQIIVEIGVAYGRTTRFLCEAARKTEGVVYGFDCFSQHGLHKQFNRFSSKNMVETRLRHCGFNNFELFELDTYVDKKIFLGILEEKCSIIDFAFIDGCHSYQGVSNDFACIYPKLSNVGIIAFHDTLVIDGCRKFMLDLRSKYYDGTYDIVDFPFGTGPRRVGVSLLVKRSFHKVNIGIDEICDLTDERDGIIENEKQWYLEQENRYQHQMKDLE